MAAGVDPYTYVLFVYDLCSEHMDWVPINMVASSKTVQRFILDRPSREAELQLILASQSDYVRTHLENGERMEEILCDPDAPLSAVFRYAVALTMELQDIANNCKESAEEMLLFEPMYGVLLERLLKCRMSPSNQ